MYNYFISRFICSVSIILMGLSLYGCGSTNSMGVILPDSSLDNESSYLIGPGDGLEIFVWRHADLSVNVQVRPDGKISTPLVEDILAAGKTPTGLARDLEIVLSTYVKSPSITVIVSGFVGDVSQQIRIVGQAVRPQALQYQQGITLLDVVISVGGLGEFAAGNRAKVIRRIGQEQITISVRLDDLINDGDISKNIVMYPGDVLIIPESRF